MLAEITYWKSQEQKYLHDYFELSYIEVPEMIFVIYLYVPIVQTMLTH